VVVARLIIAGLILVGLTLADLIAQPAANHGTISGARGFVLIQRRQQGPTIVVSKNPIPLTVRQTCWRSDH